jgi:hypothetical protein
MIEPYIQYNEYIHYIEYIWVRGWEGKDLFLIGAQNEMRCLWKLCLEFWFAYIGNNTPSLCVFAVVTV